MGCSFCNHIKNEKKNEMINDNESNSTYKLKKIHEEIDTEYLNENQSRNNDIFDFFIDLRSNPSKYIEESKQYELDDIIIYANNNKLFENIKMLINNPFFNLFLNSYVNKYPDSKENILFDLENNMQLQNYEKICALCNVESKMVCSQCGSRYYCCYEHFRYDYFNVLLDKMYIFVINFLSE